MILVIEVYASTIHALYIAVKLLSGHTVHLALWLLLCCFHFCVIICVSLNRAGYLWLSLFKKALIGGLYMFPYRTVLATFLKCHFNDNISLTKWHHHSTAEYSIGAFTVSTGP